MERALRCACFCVARVLVGQVRGCDNEKLPRGTSSFGSDPGSVQGSVLSPEGIESIPLVVSQFRVMGKPVLTVIRGTSRRVAAFIYCGSRARLTDVWRGFT